MTVKIEALVREIWRPLVYENTFSREEEGPAHLCIGPRGGHSALVLALAKVLGPPYKVLYVLHTPRGRSEPGRYESPALKWTEIKSFFRSFSPFFTGDARHDVWLHSRWDDAAIGWDRHDLLYAYGPLVRLEEVLEDSGLRRSSRPVVPVPHTHNYHAEWDAAERDVVKSFDWLLTPLHKEDEQVSPTS